MSKGVFLNSTQVYGNKPAENSGNGKGTAQGGGANRAKSTEEVIDRELNKAAVNTSQVTKGVQQRSGDKIRGSLKNTEDINKAISEDILKFPGANEMPSAERLLEDLVSELKDLNLKFEKDKETDRTVIKVIDSDSGEVIRQIPPQEFLKMVASLNKVAAELLKDLPKYI